MNYRGKREEKGEAGCCDERDLPMTGLLHIVNHDLCVLTYGVFKNVYGRALYNDIVNVKKGKTATGSALILLHSTPIT